MRVFKGDITFDASASDFTIKNITAHDKNDTTILLGFADTMDTLTIMDRDIFEDVIFTIHAAKGTKGTFDVTIICTSHSPTKSPSKDPTTDPTSDPTNDPSSDPTNDPTDDPSADPTINPTNYPTVNPTVDPSNYPTTEPTTPTSTPTTSDPTRIPTSSPTNRPTVPPPTLGVHDIKTSAPTESSTDTGAPTTGIADGAKVDTDPNPAQQRFWETTIGFDLEVILIALCALLILCCICLFICYWCRKESIYRSMMKEDKLIKIRSENLSKPLLETQNNASDEMKRNRHNGGNRKDKNALEMQGFGSMLTFYILAQYIN